MYEIKPYRQQGLRFGLGVSLFLYSLMPLQAEIHNAQSLVEQQQLVRDLIAAENQLLQTPKTAKTTPVKTSKVPSYVGPDLELRAVYGVGPRLIAEVSFRGERYLYLRGQSWPMGDPQGRSQLRLLEISSRCVRLAHKEQHFDACVSP